jgi:hypothetical protein
MEKKRILSSRTERRSEAKKQEVEKKRVILETESEGIEKPELKRSNIEQETTKCSIQ